MWKLNIVSRPALRKVVSHQERYALLIIDRNLAEYDEYDFEEIAEIDPAYNDSLYESFFEREGDYLLHKLVYESNVMNRFYLLTGNSIRSDPVRGYDDISMLIDFGKFSEKNFFEKGNESELQKIIENVPILNLQKENEYYLNILQKNIGNRSSDNFLKILQEEDDKRRIGDNLKEMRIIYEQILRECSERIPDMKENCSNDYGKIIMGSQTANWLSNNRHINSVIRNFFFSIKTIASDFGNHDNKRESSVYEPTTDTVKALVYSLKDIISWFGKICSQNSKTE
ncbi:hypothetical protein [Desulfonema magnum]|uniref:hypothetical protein n=1 Tax=Desulfonema magnum TaxID=45655 RepID=UPI001A9AF924|nr:hypothetical protein [Desulfonema magnum]